MIFLLFLQKSIKMKKLLLTTITLVALLSCGNSDNNKKVEKRQDVTTSESAVNENTYVKVLDYNKFLINVWDLEKNPNEFVFRGERPCVIDFYATWCGPCKRVAPILEKLAKEYDGKVDFYKVDVDKDQKLAMILQIKNIPTMFFMKAGAQPEKTVGAYDEAYYRGLIEKMLSE